MKKPTFLLFFAVIALVLSGCSSTTASSSSTIATSQSSPTPTASKNVSVVGFGATVGAWKAHHIADSGNKNIPGCCYDQDPSLKSWGANDRYTDLMDKNGIVTAYSLNLPEGTTLKDAKIAAMAEMPKDAKVSFFTVQDMSATLEVTSATLKPRLSDPNIGNSNGNVDFVFCSVTSDGTYGFNKSNTNFVLAKLGVGLALAKGATC